MPLEMISAKLDFMQKLTDHLQGMAPAWEILIENQLWPCPFDLSDSVFRGRLIFGEEVKPPFLSVMEAPRQIDPNGGGSGGLVQDESWTLLIQGFAVEDRVHPSDPAYTLLAWLQKRLSMITEENPDGQRGGLYPNVWKLGHKTGEIRYQIPIVRPGQDDVSASAYFYMPISVGIVTDLTKPFIVKEA